MTVMIILLIITYSNHDDDDDDEDNEDDEEEDDDDSFSTGHVKTSDTGYYRVLFSTPVKSLLVSYGLGASHLLCVAK